MVEFRVGLRDTAKLSELDFFSIYRSGAFGAQKNLLALLKALELKGIKTSKLGGANEAFLALRMCWSLLEFGGNFGARWNTTEFGEAKWDSIEAG